MDSPCKLNPTSFVPLQKKRPRPCLERFSYPLGRPSFPGRHSTPYSRSNRPLKEECHQVFLLIDTFMLQHYWRPPFLSRYLQKKCYSIQPTACSLEKKPHDLYHWDWYPPYFLTI